MLRNYRTSPRHKNTYSFKPLHVFLRACFSRFTTITSAEQREEYHEAFLDDYTEYQRLHREVDSHTRVFQQLRLRLYDEHEGSERYEVRCCHLSSKQIGRVFICWVDVCVVFWSCVGDQAGVVRQIPDVEEQPELHRLSPTFRTTPPETVAHQATRRRIRPRTPNQQQLLEWRCPPSHKHLLLTTNDDVTLTKSRPHSKHLVHIPFLLSRPVTSYILSPLVLKVLSTNITLLSNNFTKVFSLEIVSDVFVRLCEYSVSVFHGRTCVSQYILLIYCLSSCKCTTEHQVKDKSKHPSSN